MSFCWAPPPPGSPKPQSRFSLRRGVSDRRAVAGSLRPRLRGPPDSKPPLFIRAPARVKVPRMTPSTRRRLALLAVVPQHVDVHLYRRLAPGGRGVGLSRDPQEVPCPEDLAQPGPQVPAELGRDVDTVYRKARLRELPSVKVGRSLRFDLEALARFIDDHTIDTIE